MHFVGSALLESLSLWERWHCEAMTERASPARKSRCAAISSIFVSAKRALHLCFPASGLALSGAHAPALPKGEPLAGRSSFLWTSKAYLFRGL